MWSMFSLNSRGALMKMTARLPYPVSVNHVWQRAGTRTYLNPKVVNYRIECALLLANQPSFGKCLVYMKIYMFPPDKRRRDLDNICKVVLDTLSYCKIYEDDSQIHKMFLEKCKPDGKEGFLEIEIGNLETY